MLSWIWPTRFVIRPRRMKSCPGRRHSAPLRTPSRTATSLTRRRRSLRQRNNSLGFKPTTRTPLLRALGRSQSHPPFATSIHQSMATPTLSSTEQQAALAMLRSMGVATPSTSSAHVVDPVDFAPFESAQLDALSSQSNVYRELRFGRFGTPNIVGECSLLTFRLILLGCAAAAVAGGVLVQMHAVLGVVLIVLGLGSQWVLLSVWMLLLRRFLTDVHSKLQRITVPRSQRRIAFPPPPPEPSSSPSTPPGPAKVSAKKHTDGAKEENYTEVVSLGVLESDLLSVDKHVSDQRKVLADHQDFLRYMFHQVRVPLNALMIQLDLMRGELAELDASPSAEARLISNLQFGLSLAVDQGELVTYSLNQASALSAVSRVDVPLHIETFDMFKALELIRRCFERACLDKHLDIRLRSCLPPTNILVVEGDRLRIVEAVEAVVANACQAAQARTCIDIVLETIDADSIRIGVSNVATSRFRSEWLPYYVMSPTDRLKSSDARLHRIPRCIGLFKAHATCQAHGGAVHAVSYELTLPSRESEQNAVGARSDPQPTLYRTEVQLNLHTPYVLQHVESLVSSSGHGSTVTSSPASSMSLSVVTTTSTAMMMHHSLTRCRSTAAADSSPTGRGYALASVRPPAINLHDSLYASNDKRASSRLHRVYTPSAEWPTTTSPHCSILTPLPALFQRRPPAVLAASLPPVDQPLMQSDGTRDSSLPSSASSSLASELSPGEEGRQQHLPLSHLPPIDGVNSDGLRKLVLIVEDEKTTRRLLERLVHVLGFDVCSVTDGVECLAEFGIDHIEAGASGASSSSSSPVNGKQKPRRRFDAVLMDGTMHRLDGVQTTRILRHSGLSLPIIAVTANVTQADQAAFLEAGANLVLPKPIARTQLRDALHAFLGAPTTATAPSRASR
jgi:CheY-like chemotaxis protein/signal transduction histidine kinase